jgi:glutamate racemase
MTPAPAKILVFDSGLGGISILEAIQQQHPGCALIYCSDNAAFPYGTKPEAQLIERVGKVFARLDREFHPDILVVACNTASTVALPHVRNLVRAPVIGVVPAIKPAAAIAQTPRIGLLATPGTIQRSYTQSLIDEFGSHYDWIKVGSSELVQLAEHKMYGGIPAQSSIEKIVAPFTQFSAGELDTLVLACTHFPLVKQELQSALPGIKNWIDSTSAIANRVGFWLGELGLNGNTLHAMDRSHQIVFTKVLDEKENIAQVLKKFHLGKTSILDI